MSPDFQDLPDLHNLHNLHDLHDLHDLQDLITRILNSQLGPHGCIWIIT
jgi:hypothetical protein